MTSNPATRKPVNRLTFEDFRAFPIWEYTDDEEGVEGQDETWVRPMASQVVPERSYTHVAAVLSTSRGRELTGFVTVSTLEGPPVVRQGVIFHQGQGLFISNPEAFGFLESRSELLQALGATESDVFPIAFRLLAPVTGVPNTVSGVLP